MIRNAIKITCLLPLMALALGTGAASPAGAEVTLTAGTTGMVKEETTLTGVQYGGTTDPEEIKTTNYFEAGLPTNKQRIHCANENVSYNGTTAGDVKELTIAPSYGQCRTLNAEHKEGLYATVSENECDYALRQPSSEAEGVYTGKVDLKCPVGQTLDIHLYLDAAHTISLCAITIEPFEKIGHVAYVNQPDGDEGTADVAATVTMEGIPYILHGACDSEGEPTRTREDAKFFSTITLTGNGHDIVFSGE